MGFVVNKRTPEEGFLSAFMFSRQLLSHVCPIGPPDLTVPTHCLHPSAIKHINVYSRIPLTSNTQEPTDDRFSNYSTLNIKSEMSNGVKIPPDTYNIAFIMI